MRRYIETEHAKTRIQLAFMQGAGSMLIVIVGGFLGAVVILEWLA